MHFEIYSKTTFYTEKNSANLYAYARKARKKKKEKEKVKYFASMVERCFFSYFIKFLSNKKHEKEKLFCFLARDNH